MTEPTTPLLLAGKAALVVGGGRGIGRAVSLTLGAAGADVAVVDLEPDRVESVAAELTVARGSARAVALTADIRDPEQVAAVVRETCNVLGGIDVLVTVVGGQTRSPSGSRRTSGQTRSGTSSSASTSATCSWSRVRSSA